MVIGVGVFVEVWVLVVKGIWYFICYLEWWFGSEIWFGSKILGDVFGSISCFV